MSKTYESSGVSLEAGYASVKEIAHQAKRTYTQGVLGGIGGFGGMFDLSAYLVNHPVLVSSTDGVGTKLLLAIEHNRHETIGIDLVAMCVNDLVVCGAKPLFFLDYIALSKLEVAHVTTVIKGIADGCIEADCALIGGETAEMPGMYATKHYDLAGFSVGIVDKSKVITPSKVKTGDVLIGIASSGVHSNGYSLVRKIIKDAQLNVNQMVSANKTLLDLLLEPTKIYVKPILALLKDVDVHGIAHITGGGFDENIPRMLQDTQGVTISKHAWKVPAVFDILKTHGNIESREMYRIFNMGIGMVLAVDKDDVEHTLKVLNAHHEEAMVIGHVTDSVGVTLCE